jgi:hypothetical protein
MTSVSKARRAGRRWRRVDYTPSTHYDNSTDSVPFIPERLSLLRHAFALELVPIVKHPPRKEMQTCCTPTGMCFD